MGYNNINKNDYCYDVVTSEERIDKINSYIREEEHEVEKHQYVLDLFKRDRLSIVKREINYDMFEYINYDEVKTWLTMINKGCDKDGNRYDKRRHYKCKDQYDLLVHALEKNFVEDGMNVEVTEIIQFGMERCAEEVVFKINGHEDIFVLTIPIKEHLTLKNFELVSFGKYSLSKRSGQYCTNYIASSYEEKDIKDALMKDIKEKL